MRRFEIILAPCLFALLLATACENDLSVPDDAVISCAEGGTACPDGFICSSELGECVKVGSGDEVAPEVLASSVSPSPAGPGTTLTADFVVSKVLAREPSVLLVDALDPEFTFQSRERIDHDSDGVQDEERFIFTRTVTGQESQQRAYEVEAQRLVDAFGKVTAAAKLNNVSFDFTAPGFSELSPSERGLLAARRGAALTLQFTASEELNAAQPTVTLTNVLGADVAELAYQSHDPQTRRYTYTLGVPDKGWAEGEHGVTIAVTDPAGNPGEAAFPSIWRLDFTPPEISDQDVTPEVAGPDTRIFASFTVSEPLAAGVEPAVELRPDAGGEALPMEALTPQGLAYTFQYTTAAGSDDAFTAVLSGLQDAAGNPADEATLGRVTIDTVAPAFVDDPPLALVGDGLHREGELVGVRFSATEAVQVEAFVDFGAVRVPLAPADPQTDPLEFNHLPTAGDPEGSGLVVVRIADDAGNAAPEAKAGPVVFDFTAPEVISGTPSPAAAKRGDTLVYAVSVSEALSTTSPPVLTVAPAAGGAPLDMGDPTPSGTLYTWTLAVDGTVPEGDYVASLDLTDVAGNPAAGVTTNLQGFSVDATLPTITAHEVPRTLARATQDVTVSFTVSEPLAADPVVMLGTIGMTKDPTSAGLDYVYTHTADGTEAEQAHTISVQLEDEAGNQNPLLLPETVSFDFTAPGVVSGQASPPKAKLGADVIITVTVNEDLAETGGISLRVDPDPGFTLQPAAGRSYSWVHRVVSGDTPGDYAFFVSLQDPAGNPSGELSDPGWTFEIDNTQPDVTDVELGRLLPDSTLAEAYVKRADTLEARFGTTKPLAEDPVVMAGPYAMTGGWDDALGKYRYAYTFGADEAEGSHAVTAELTDLADNVRFVNLGTVGVDNHAPALIDSQASPTVAKLGATVALTLTVTEPIDVAQAPTTFNIEVSAGLDQPFTYFGNVGLNYIFRHTVTDQDQPGDYTVTGYFCDKAGNCLDDRIDLDGFRIENEVPGVENVALTPADGYVAADEEVRVTFDVTKVLEGDPLVSVGGKPMTMQSGDGTSFAFTYSTHELAMEGRQVITAELHDPAGNVVFEELGRVTFDFTDPEVVAGSASPDPAKVKSVIIYTLNVSEDLGDTPTIAVNPPTIVLDGPTQNGTVYRWTHTVADGEPDGKFDVTFGLCDLAGNCVPAAPGDPFEVDASLPSITAHSVSPLQARAGQQIEVTFTTSEVMLEDPAVVLGEQVMTKHSSSSHEDYVYRYTADGSEGDGTRTVSVQLTDLAGNQQSVIFSEVVEFDFTAPSIASSVASPDPARLGATVTYQVTLSEAPAAAPDLVTSPSLAWTAQPPDGLTYSWTHAVQSGETDAYTAGLDQICDAAGNCADVAGRTGVGFTLDADAPGITVHDVSPDRVKNGETVTISFTVDEDLAGEPTVILGDLPMIQSLHSGRDYSYTYLARSIDGDGVRAASVNLLDPAGNQSSVVFPETVEFDFTAPSIVASGAQPDPAKLGSRITYQATVSEPLSNGPALVTNPALTWDPPSLGGLTFTWGRDAGAGETGPYTAALDQLCDKAGNCATSVPANGFAIDVDKPGTTASNVSPLRVKHGETVTVTFTTDEDLVADPVVLLGENPMGQTAHSGRDYTYQYTADENSDNDGVFTVSLQMVDDAGNPSSEVFGDTVEFDFTPPGIISSVASPDPAKVGNTITYRVKVSEALTNTPHLGSTPVLAWTGPTQAGNDYSWTHTVLAGGTTSYTAAIDQLCDAAGNCATNVGGVGFAVDADPPSTTVHDVSPALVRDGQTVTVSFTAGEDLGSDPVVMLGAIQMAQTLHAGRDYTYSYTTKGTEGDGVRSVSVQMVDLAGNPSSEAFAETVSFDFTAPSIVASVASPDPAKLGSKVNYQITVSEPLSNTPDLATTPPLAWTPQAPAGLRYGWSHTVVGGGTTSYTARIDQLCDVAGNCATNLAGTGFDVDADPPTTTVHGVNPLRVKDGEAVTVTFTASEELAAAPTVILGSRTMSQINQSGRDYTYRYTAQDVPDVDGVYTVSVQMVDDAGNASSEVFGETVEFDFTAPSVISTTAAPDPAKLGSTVTYRLKVDEPLTNTPVLSTAPPLAWGAPAQSGNDYTWTVVIAGGGTTSYTASIDQLCDQLANCDGPLLVNGFDVDADPPTTSVHGVNPALVRAGQLVTVTFTADEDLGSTPVVMLGDAQMAMSNQSGRDYTFEYTATGAEGEGVRSVAVQMVDLAGNPNSESFAETVTFDFTAPDIVASVASPDPAKLGSAMTYQITVNEPLSNVPALVSNPALAWSAQAPGGNSYSWTHTAGAGETGGYSATIDQLCDQAGNCATNVAGAGFTIDVDEPATTVHAVNPAAVRSGQLVTVTFTASEDLAATPEVRLGSITMSLFNQSGRDYEFRHTAQAGDGDGLRSVSVLMLDLAGNQGSETFAETVDFDTTAPTVVSSIASPDPARLGATVTYSVIVSEALDHPPTLVTAPVRAWVGPVQDGQTWEWTYTVGAGDSGSYTAAVQDLEDLAGNTTASAATAGFDLDADAPTASNFSLSHPSGSKLSSGVEFKVSFDVTENLGLHADYPKARLGDIEMIEIAAEGGRDHTFRHMTTGGEDDGVYTVVVELADDAGNTSTASPGNIELDFIKPELVLTQATPTDANGSDTIFYDVTADEPLGSNPDLHVSGPAAVGFTHVGGTTYKFQHPVQAGDDGTYTVTIDLEDEAGNQNNGLSQHADLTPVAGFSIDASVPAISNLTTTSTVYSDVTDHNDLQVEFDCSEDVGTTAPGVEVLVQITDLGATRALGCSRDGGNHYTCNTTVLGSEDEGSRNITVRTQDAAGNGDFDATSVGFDFTAPGVILPTVVTTLTPGGASALSSVSKASNGTVVQVVFTVTETLGNDVVGPPPTPRVVSQPTGLVLDQIGKVGNQYTYSGQYSGIAADTERDDTLRIITTPGMEDLAGNTPSSAIDLDTVGIDTDPPDPPLVGTPDLVVYHRAPWGSTDTAGNLPEFRVTGGAGAAESSEPDHTRVVIAYSTYGTELGRIAVGNDGAFDLILAPVDYPAVELAVADPAGNISTRAEVRDVEWTATMGLKEPGSIIANPHVLQTTDAHAVSLVQSAKTTAEPSAADLDRVDADDADYFIQQARQTWEQMSFVDDQPPARTGQMLAYDRARGRVLLYGGEEFGVQYFDDLWAWDSQTRRWEDISPNGIRPPLRRDGGIAYDARRDTVVLFGGYWEGTYRGDTWEYDFTTGLWTDVTPAAGNPDNRMYPTMMYDAQDGRVLMHGGRIMSGSCNGSGSENCIDTWAWDGDAGAWTEITPGGTQLPTVWLPQVVLDEARHSLLAHSAATQQDTWEWVIGTANWVDRSPGGLMPYTGYIGYDPVRDRTYHVDWGNTFPYPMELWEWNGADGSWTDITPATTTMSSRQAHMVFDRVREKLIQTGGAGAVFETYEFDGSNWSRVTNGTSQPSARSYFAMAYDSDRQKVVMFGGLDPDSVCPIGTGYYCKDTWEWDTRTRTWSEITLAEPFAPASGRGYHRMVYDKVNQRVLLFGGRDNTTDCSGTSTNSYCNETWEYDGPQERWFNTTPAGTKPTGRLFHSMAYVDVQGLALLHGGNTGGDETWTWDSATRSWDNVTAAGGPTGLTWSPMAYDSDEKLVVMFGGPGETWHWDAGNGWQQQTTTGSPDLALGYPMAYDPTRHKAMLAVNGQFWEYDAPTQTWTQATPARNPGTGTYEMVADSNAGKLVWFGGPGAGDETPATWLWDGHGGDRGGAYFEVNWPRANADVGAAGVTFDQLDVEVVVGGQGYLTTAIPAETCGELGGVCGSSCAKFFYLYSDPLGCATGCCLPDGVVPTSAGVSNTLVEGVDLFAWSAQQGAWQPLASNGSGLAAPSAINDTISVESEILDLIFGSGETFNFAMLPAEVNGGAVDMGSLALDYLELKVKYTRQ